VESIPRPHPKKTRAKHQWTIFPTSYKGHNQNTSGQYSHTNDTIQGSEIKHRYSSLLPPPYKYKSQTTSGQYLHHTRVRDKTPVCSVPTPYKGQNQNTIIRPSIPTTLQLQEPMKSITTCCCTSLTFSSCFSGALFIVKMNQFLR